MDRAALALLIANVCYRVAVALVGSWGEIVKASFDTGLPALAAKLGFSLPKSDAERRIRLANAEREMQRMSEYDYVIVNHRDRLEQAVGDLKSIVVAERIRVCPRTITL